MLYRRGKRQGESTARSGFSRQVSSSDVALDNKSASKQALPCDIFLSGLGCCFFLGFGVARAVGLNVDINCPLPTLRGTGPPEASSGGGQIGTGKSAAVRVVVFRLW